MSLCNSIFTEFFMFLPTDFDKKLEEILNEKCGKFSKCF
jgi:hypothetical protein